MKIFKNTLLVILILIGLYLVTFQNIPKIGSALNILLGVCFIAGGLLFFETEKS